MRSKQISKCTPFQNLLSINFSGIKQCTNWERKCWCDSSPAKNHNQYKNSQISHIHSAPPQQNSNQHFIFLLAYISSRYLRRQQSELTKPITDALDIFLYAIFNSWLFPLFSLLKLNLSLIIFKSCFSSHFYIPFSFISFPLYILLFFFTYKSH